MMEWQAYRQGNSIDDAIKWKYGELGITSYLRYLDILIIQIIKPFP